MLSYSSINVLSFTNKVVKVQPQKFVRSLYGVPRILQYQTPKNHHICSDKVIDKTQLFSVIQLALSNI